MNDIIERITGCSYDRLEIKIPDSVVKDTVISVFEDIIEGALSGVASGDKPFLLNISGTPGSGKSTWCRRVMALSSDILYISFDEIMKDERLPYLTDEKVDAQKAFDEWELPARIAGYELLKRGVEQKKNILFEHSSSIPEHVRLFEALIENGYEVHFRYISVSVPEAEKRVHARAEKEGRIVPRGYIEDRDKRLRELLPVYSELCTTYKVLHDIY